MALKIIGSQNLASDMADQMPSTMKRSKEGTALPWPERRIEVVDLGGGFKKVIFYYYDEFPTDEWSAIKYTFGTSFLEIDMSTCTMKELGDGFWQMSRLSKVTLPPRLEKLSTNSFNKCGTAAASFEVVMPNTLKIIGSNAFSQCTTLKLERLPDSVTEIGYRAFDNSTISISKLPASLKTLGQLAFANTNVSIEKIPASVEMGNGGTFENCNNITEIEIACKTVPNITFRNCSALKKAWLRSSCEEIKGDQKYNSPFAGCPADLEIYAEPSSKPDGWSAYYNFTGSSPDYVEVDVVFNQKTSPF